MHTFVSALVSFRGRLIPAARKTLVTIAVERLSRSGAVAEGSTTAKAERVFNTQPAPLQDLFGAMAIVPRPGARYRISVNAMGVSLASATLALTP